MIPSTALVALAGLAFGWFYRLISKFGRCGWLTEVVLPATIGIYSLVVAMPNLSSSLQLPVLLSGALTLLAGFFFDQHSLVEGSGTEKQGRRDTWPLLIWGIGALGYIGAPLVPSLDGLASGVFCVGAGSLLGQSLSWVWRLVDTKGSGGIPGLSKGFSRIGGSVAAVLALLILLPGAGTGIGSLDIGGAKAPANSFLIGTGALDNKPIYVVDSGSYHTLSATGGKAHWSPDGTRMALTRKQGGLMQVFVAAADGSGLNQLTQMPGDVLDCLWSADGQQIYFLHGPSFVQSALSAVPAAGGNPEEVLPLTQSPSSPVISPDGTKLAYVRGIDFSAGVRVPPKEIKVLDLATRQTTSLVTQPTNDWNVTDLTWTRDGQALLLNAQTQPQGPYQLQRIDIAQPGLVPLGQPNNYYLRSFTWTASGMLIALAQPAMKGSLGMPEWWEIDPATGAAQVLQMPATPEMPNSVHGAP